jgi:hypothetical protein
MSNALAIASVTATLTSILQANVAGDVAGAHVVPSRPDPQAAGRPPGVNVFLYNVSPNGALRNDDLPTRRADGTFVQRPTAALDLHYLLICYGDEAQYEPQRLLGSIVRAMHARPALTGAEIAAATGSAPFTTFSERSDLADQIERVRFTQVGLSLQELSGLWSSFFQTPYVLSIAYTASVVLIESTQTPFPALPVRERAILVQPFRNPAILSVGAVSGPLDPIESGTVVAIRGQQLAAPQTMVRLGTRLYAPATTSDTEITLPIPADVRAGIVSVQIVLQTPLGAPSTLRTSAESNAAAFVLRPTIALQAVTATSITIGVTPPVGAGQRATLILNATDATAASAYAFDILASADAATLVFPIAGVTAGSYIMRLHVDGAQSVLTVDLTAGSATFDRYVGPPVTVP